MRPLVIVLALFGLPSVVFAQEQDLRSARGQHVAVIDQQNREWQGRLLEIAQDAIVVEVDSSARRFDLVAVKRVDAHGDRVVDGAIKGAIFGAFISMAVMGPRYAPGAMAIYGLIGLGADAMNNCHHTVYRAPATKVSATISW
jgi:hypothetical protein